MSELHHEHHNVVDQGFVIHIAHNLEYITQTRFDLNRAINEIHSGIILVLYVQHQDIVLVNHDGGQ